MSSIPQRILIIRNDRIGDVVLTLPAMQTLRRALPASRITALVTDYTAPLLLDSGFVDELIIDRPRTNSQALARRLRSGRFEAALVINTSWRNCLAVWLAGIPIRVCWGVKPAGMLFGNRRLFIRRAHPPVHESRFCLSFVQRITKTPANLDRGVSLRIDPECRRHMSERIGKLVGETGPLFCVHPGNGGSAFNWPLKCYRELVLRLSAVGRVLVTGSPDERRLLSLISRDMATRRAYDVAALGDLTLRELVATISLSDTLTVSSTGPMHLAGMVGTPVVAIFSPHEAHQPLKWAPLGQGHSILTPALRPGEASKCGQSEGFARMKRIRVDDVFRATLDRLPSRSVPQPRGQVKCSCETGSGHGAPQEAGLSLMDCSADRMIG